MSDETPEPAGKPAAARQIADVMSTTANDALWTQHVAFHNKGLSAARVFGDKYIEDGRSRSEDSFHAEMNYNGGTPVSRDDADVIMHAIVAGARRKTEPITEGGATFAAALTSDDGIMACSIGDSHIFLAGDKGAVQLNMPHRAMPAPENKMRGGMTNRIGGDVVARAADEYQFISYTDPKDKELWEKVGDNPRIVVASDGIVERSAGTAIVAQRERDFLRIMKENNEAAFAEMGESRNAKDLANKARTLGSRDDIAIISFKVKPGDKEHIAALVSDGMGGKGEKGVGGEVSRVGINAAAEALHSEIKRMGVDLEYNVHQGQGYDPVPVSGVAVIDEKDRWRHEKLAELTNRERDAITLGADGIATVDAGRLQNPGSIGELHSLKYVENRGQITLNEEDSGHVRLIVAIQDQTLREVADAFPDAASFRGNHAVVDTRKLTGAHPDLTGDLADIGVEQGHNIMLGTTHSRMLAELMAKESGSPDRGKVKER